MVAVRAWWSRPSITTLFLRHSSPFCPLCWYELEKCVFLVPSHKAVQIPWSNWVAAVKEGIWVPCPPWSCTCCLIGTKAQLQESGSDLLPAAPAISCHLHPSTALCTANCWRLYLLDHNSGAKGGNDSCCYCSKRASTCLRVTLALRQFVTGFH